MDKFMTAFVTRGGSAELHGGSKAWRDLVEAARRTRCEVHVLPGRGLRYLLALARLRLARGSVVILPYPDLPSIRRRGVVRHAATLTEIGLLAVKKLLRSLRIVVYVYDLPIEQHEAVEGSLPSHVSRLEERWILKIADVVGVVGWRMEAMLAKHNPHIQGKCLYYEFIPYYAPLHHRTTTLAETRTIAFVGNLHRSRLEKAVLGLPTASGMRYTFYGPDGAWLAGARSDFSYAGAFPAEDLSAIVGSSADFGLILYDVTNPPMTAYLSMTTTSKLFCYLCAGLPILAYRYDHLAELVETRDLGVIFGAVQDLPDAVSRVGAKTYAALAAHVAEFAAFLSERESFGHFVSEAVAMLGARTRT